METCENCGTVIGKLEVPHLFNDSVVCKSCHARLTAATVRLQYETPEGATASQTGPSGSYAKAAGLALSKGPGAAIRSIKSKPPAGPPIICPNPNCGYVGPSNRESKGSVILAVILLLIGIIPGLIYGVVASGHTISCPVCGTKVRDD